MQLNDPVIVLVSPGATPVEHDITEIVSSVTFELSRSVPSGQNTFGVNGVRREIAGLWDGSLAITFHHNYESSEITQLIYEWMAGGIPIGYSIKANDATTSTDNPEWYGEVLVTQLPIVDGDPDSIAAASVTWNTNGEPAVSYAP